ncbi:hypothetical protein C7B63_04850 [Bacillus halotolerans]|nr:hypothetical protein C7B63_04850 [Bacillus halotolerans]PRP60512.1 hypothetical protein C7B66_00625 [Bacillus halotolerans]PRP65177.1 hypothetical protein C7B72_00620 [Bacillus halotolerans]
MNRIAYFLSQFLLSCIIIAISFFNGLYIGNPFSHVLLVFILVLALFHFLKKLKKRFLHIRMSLLLAAFLSAILCMRLITGEITFL